MNAAFEVHMLNEGGKAKAQELALAFNDLLEKVSSMILSNGATDSWHLAIVRTKLEEACFFAKKGMASQPENQA